MEQGDHGHSKHKGIKVGGQFEVSAGCEEFCLLEVDMWRNLGE